MSTWEPLKPRLGVDPLVIELSNILRRKHISRHNASVGAGLHKNTINRWLNEGITPNASNLQAALNFVGYELHIRTIEP
jgi:hypothetical protein